MPYSGSDERVFVAGREAPRSPLWRDRCEGCAAKFRCSGFIILLRASRVNLTPLAKLCNPGRRRREPGTPGVARSEATEWRHTTLRAL